MRFPFLIAAAFVLGSTAVQAAGSVGGTSHGSSFGASPGAPGSPSFNPTAGTTTHQNFGALPGAPGSPSFNPTAGASPGIGIFGTSQGANIGSFGASPGIGVFGALPGAPGSSSFSPTTDLPSIQEATSLPSAPNVTIPGVDEVVPSVTTAPVPAVNGSVTQ